MSANCIRKFIHVIGFGKTIYMGFFLKIEFDVWLISSIIELALCPGSHGHKATIELTCIQVPDQLRALLYFIELQRFLCNRATPPTIEKLRSIGIAMHAYGVSVYYAYTGNQLNEPGWSPSKWMQRSNESWISPSIMRAVSSSMPKRLKRLANVH